MALTITGVSIAGVHASKFIPPTGVLTFTTPTAASVTMQNSLTNTATSTLSGGRYGAITYASSNTGIATVNSTTGVITPVAPGSCIITATQAAVTDVNSQATQTYTLTVNALPIGTITFTTPSSASVNMGNNLTNTATSTLSGGSYGAITYSSSNTAIATVGLTTGVVTPVAPGSCVITATQASVTGVNAQATQTYNLQVNSLITTTTWLPANASSSGMTFSNGNLTVTCQSVGAGKMGYTASPASTNKKVYWEITATNSALLLGIALSTANLSNSLSNQASAGISYSYYINNGFIYDGVSNRKASGLSTTGTKFGFALDTTAGAMKIQFYSNGVAQGSPISLADGSYYPAFGFQSNNSTGLTANFGSSAFNYTPPTGFTSFNSNL